MGDIWELRSNAVHAEPYKVNDVPRLAETAENYLREAIKRYAELERNLTPHAHADILRWLDDSNVDTNKQKVFPHWKTV